MKDENGALYIPMQTDNKEFIGAMNEAERRVKGFSDATGTSGEKISKTLKTITAESVKLTNSFQKESRREVGLIADIENELQKLKEKKRNAFTVESIEKYNRKIQEAEIALKEYNEAGRKSIDNDKKHSDIVEKLSGHLVKWTAGLLSVSAATGIAKGIIESTGKTAMFFTTIMTEAKTEVEYFFKAIATGNWTNFRKGFEEASASAREYVEEMKDIANRENEQTIKNADALKEIAALREGTFDKGEENNDKLIENLGKIIEIQKRDYKEQAEIAKDTYETALDHAASLNRLDKDKLENLIAEYSKNKEILEIGDKYLVLQARLNAARKVQNNTDRVNEIQAEIRALGEGAEAAGNLAKEYGSLTKEEKATLAGLKANQIALEGQSQIGSRRDENQLAAALNKKKAAEEEANKKAAESEKKLWKSYFDWFYDQVDIQIKKLKDLKKDNTDSTESFNKIDPGKGYSILDRAVNRPASADSYGGTNKTLTGTEAGQLRPFDQGYWDARNKKQIAQLKTEEELLAAQLELRMRIIGAAADLTNQIAEQIGMTEEQQKSLDATFTMLEQGLSGDWLGLAATMISQLIAVIPSHAKEFASEIEYINQLLAEQERLIQQSERSGNQKGEEQKKLDLLNKQKKATEDEIAKTQKNLDGFFGAVYAGTGAGKRLEKLKQDLIDIDNQIEDTGQSIDDLMTGGIVENDIADIITNALIEGGKAGVNGIAQSMKDILGPALMQIFKDQYLLPMINKEFMPMLNSFMEGGLSKDEIETLTKWAENAAEILGPTWDAMLTAGGAMNGLSDNSKALSGAIKGVSESTASVIAGQMNAMRVTQAEISGMMRQQLFHLSEIAVNTRYNKHLESIDNKLDNLKPDSLRSQGY